MAQFTSDDDGLDTNSQRRVNQNAVDETFPGNNFLESLFAFGLMHQDESYRWQTDIRKAKNKSCWQT